MLLRPMLTANVWNPDGVIGVTLHVESNTSPPIALVDCTTIWPGYDSLKAANIGTLTERTNNPFQLQEESNVKVYGLFVHYQCGKTGSSGIAENPGNDFAISLGSFTGGTGNRMQQASSFMHELGHTLGLKHGGSASTPDCKPNFLSVMNTEFQFADDVPGRKLDYSRNSGSSSIRMEALLETVGLVEQRGIGIGLPTPPVPITVIGHANQPSGRDILRVPTDHTPVNYNWYQGDMDTSDTVKSAIHNVGRPGCDNTNNNSLADLYSYWDWVGARFWAWSYKNLNYQSEASVSPSLGILSGGPTAFQLAAIDGQQQTGSQENDNKSIVCNPLEKSCEISPCDPQDKACIFVKETNLTESANENYDYGNRTNTHQDQSFEDIKSVHVANLISFNNKIQSLPKIAFNSSANSTDVKLNFSMQMVTGKDNIAQLVSNSSFQTAISRLEEIRDSMPGLLVEHYLTPLLVDIDYLIAGLRNMLPDIPQAKILK